MENQTQFSLENALIAWRRQFDHAAIDPGSRAELEGHLRDSVAELERVGYSPEDAFAVASYRLGQAGALAEEFARAHPERIWFERVLCMLLGAQAVMLLGQFANFVRGLIFFPREFLLGAGGGEVTKFSTILVGATQYLILGGLLICAFRVITRKRQAWENWIEALCRRPGKWCGALLVLSLVMACLSFGSGLLPVLTRHWLLSPRTPVFGTMQFSPSLGLFLIVAAVQSTLIPTLTFWFLRRHRRQITARA